MIVVMSLKESIVIVNEFTVKQGKGGSRGGTPGDYVTRYMARDLATERVTPARLAEVDTYIERYMARESAVESSQDVPELKHKMQAAQKRGGVAFGYGDVALSEEKLVKASKDIQANFEKGKTVFKTILSFSEDYLREHGLIDSSFTCKHRGDYRGHLDQLKLRMAVMNGLSKLAKSYDDLQYVGVIQVDTMHVHVHLAMVDRGVGNLMPDGSQRGKITARGKQILRRGVDTYLDRKQTVKMMSSSVMYDKQNALCYIKKFTHQAMDKQGLPQFLLACLPEDRRLWRAGTNRKEMRKANSMVREYVVEILSQPGSGYQDAMRDITAYADYRMNREGLSLETHDRLIREGQRDLVESCMNGVYGVLREIPKEKLTVRTPMMSAMAMDYDSMAAEAVNDPMMEFGFRLRSYSSRMKHHKKEYHKFRDEYRSYEAAENKSEDAKALGDYLKIEQDYNQMLLVKYQYFLSFLPPEENIEEEFREIREKEEELERLRKMYEDEDLRHMDAEAAEAYGVQMYGEYGGRRLKAMPEILERRISQKQDILRQQMVGFQDRLLDCGLFYDGTGIVRKLSYSFDRVKALDLHHLGYDFPYDCEISKPNVDMFREMAEKRYQAFLLVKDYLIHSGQSDAVKVLPEQDVLYMKQFSDQLAKEPVLVSTRPSGSGGRRMARTCSLDMDYLDEMASAVESSVSNQPVNILGYK